MSAAGDDRGPEEAGWALAPVTFEVHAEESFPASPGWLRLRRLSLSHRIGDAPASPPYGYELVERRATDAVVIALHTAPRAPGATRRVCLRSAVRPPLHFRRELRVPGDAELGAALWELPAGLVEADEQGEAGLRACAARETLEETGFTVAPEDFVALGAPVFLSPGVLAERLWFFAASVSVAERGVPTEDGSPLEAGARVGFVALAEALRAADAGQLGDAKSELGLRRLAALFAREGRAGGAGA
ncbi:MAG: NUDIX domain-containing protein [Myxococcota bacterium]